MKIEINNKSFRVLGFIQLNLSIGDYGQFKNSLDCVKVANYGPEDGRKTYTPEQFEAAYEKHVNSRNSDLYAVTINLNRPDAVADVNCISKVRNEKIEEQEFIELVKAYNASGAL